MFNLDASLRTNTMIHWLIQSTSAHPNLSRIVPPQKLLNAEETVQFTNLKTDKRRRDWLLGRWTAKHLLQAVHEKQTGERLPLNAFSVLKSPDGSPRAYVCGSPCYGLSISHSYNHAFCTATPNVNVSVGADIECIEARSDNFIADFFTADEMDIVCPMDRLERDVIATAIWSAKEAVLKTLRLGLIVDTRAVTCLIEPSYRAFESWVPFNVAFDNRYLSTDYNISGWWRLHKGFVLTMAAGQLAFVQPVDYKQVYNWN